MANENAEDEFAAKDVFVLLGVPVPENLTSKIKREEKTSDDNDDNKSQSTVDEDDKVQIEIITKLPVVDVTPPEESDHSYDSDSETKSEFEESRWYDPTSTKNLEKSEFELLKNVLKIIKNGDATKTLAALSMLKTYKIAEESYQNMFFALNGLEVLVNIIECDNDDCMKEALAIIHEMSQLYGTQCMLCDLGAVKTLVRLLYYKTVDIQYLAVDTLQSVSKLKKGRKLIRLYGGIPIMAQLLDAPNRILFSSKQELNAVEQTVVRVVSSCSGALRLLCRSLKSQEHLCHTGFTELLPQLLNSKHSEIQVSIMSIMAECSRLRPNVVGHKTRMNVIYKLTLKELKLLPKIIKCMVSNTTELVVKAADTMLNMIGDDPSVYNVILKNKGLNSMFKTIKKYQKDERVMIPVTAILWKCSFDDKCRQVIEKDIAICNTLVELLNYRYDDQVIGYAVATLSELWKAESLRFLIKQKALPQYLKLLEKSRHSLILTHVCNALGRASKDPECMEMINKANGFRLIFKLLPSLEIDEFDKYKYFYEPETIIAAAECLTALMNNALPNLNNLKGMYQALNDLVDLLTHKNVDILSVTCQLIEVTANYDENLRIMIDAGVIDNLANLVPTKHPNLRANLCRALGKCCSSGINARRFSCKQIVDQLYKYMRSEHKIVRENLPLALSGLSEDPLNCIKIEALGFLSFLKMSVKSKNFETSLAAALCLRNIRRVSFSIGKYKECSEIKNAK